MKLCSVAVWVLASCALGVSNAETAAVVEQRPIRGSAALILAIKLATARRADSESGCSSTVPITRLR
jgi:hypothetical protein